MTMASNDEFAERLARVKANKGRSVIMVGHDESFVHEWKRPTKGSKKSEVADNIANPINLFGALLIGIFAAALGYYARFHMAGGITELPSADAEMVLSGFIGLSIAFTLSQILRLRTFGQKIMQALGVFLMVSTFHNLNFWAPRAMETLFSPQFVLQATYAAVPNSFRFRGVYIPLGEEASLPNSSVSFDDGPALATAPAEPSCGLGAGDTVKRIKLNGETHKSLEDIGPAVSVPTCP